MASSSEPSAIIGDDGSIEFSNSASVGEVIVANIEENQIRNEDDVTENNEASVEQINDENDDAAAIEGSLDNMPFEFTAGLKGKNPMIFTTIEKQLYFRNKKYGNGAYYVCAEKERGCKVTLFYDEQTQICSRKRKHHTHGIQENRMKHGKLRQVLKEEFVSMSGSNKRNKMTVRSVIAQNVRE